MKTPLFLFLGLLLLSIASCTKEAKSTTVHAKVVRFSDQAPLNNARVQITASGNVVVATKYTDANGNVDFTGIAAGNYEAVGFWEGDASTTSDDLIDYDALGHPSFQLTDGSTVSVTIQLK